MREKASRVEQGEGGSEAAVVMRGSKRKASAAEDIVDGENEPTSKRRRVEELSLPLASMVAHLALPKDCFPLASMVAHSTVSSDSLPLASMVAHSALSNNWPQSVQAATHHTYHTLEFQKQASMLAH